MGSVYVAYNSTTPATRFGGTWTAITGRFPYFNAGTDTGGANTVTLTVDQIPSHTHHSGRGYVHALYNADSQQVLSWEKYTDGTSGNLTSATGGGKSHNNMPAYQTLYAWRRTA